MNKREKRRLNKVLAFLDKAPAQVKYTSWIRELRPMIEKVPDSEPKTKSTAKKPVVPDEAPEDPKGGEEQPPGEVKGQETGEPPV